MSFESKMEFGLFIPAPALPAAEPDSGDPA